MHPKKKRPSAKKDSSNKDHTAIPSQVKKASPEYLIYGTHAVIAALKNKKRKCHYLVTTPSKQVTFQDIIKTRNIPLITTNSDSLRQLLPMGSVHQSVILMADPLPIKQHIPDLSKKKKHIIMMLDGVSDPHNLGAILRNCAAFSCDMLIIQERFSAAMTSIVAKSAAGALEKVKIIRVPDLKEALIQLKDQGYHCYGASGHARTYLDKIEFSEKSLFILGAEGQGMRQSIEKKCDSVIKINIHPEMESLNVSNASAIILHHYYLHSIQ